MKKKINKKPGKAPVRVPCTDGMPTVSLSTSLSNIAGCYSFVESRRVPTHEEMKTTIVTLCKLLS